LLAGQPLAGQIQPGTLNPLNWLLFAAPLKDGFISRGALHWMPLVLMLFLRVTRGERRAASGCSRRPCLSSASSLSPRPRS
jgi:hypothetical protein